MSLEFVQRYIKNNQSYIKNAQIADGRYRDFQERGPFGVVLHSIGTPQPKAEPIAEYFDSPTVESSVHMILEPSGKCLCLAPENYRLWHVGGSANNTHLGVELTEPKEISYDPKKGYAVTILDREKALAHVMQTYERGVELFALLCEKYGWDPLSDGVILSHRECYRRGLGSNHGDPEHLWEALHTGYTMDTFRKAVSEALNARKTETDNETAGVDKSTTEGQEGLNAATQAGGKPTPSDSGTPTEENNGTDNIPQEGEEPMIRYTTLGDLKLDPNSKFYLPTVEKLISRGYLKGQGGEGDQLLLDLSEEAVRILVTLDRAGAYGEE